MADGKNRGIKLKTVYAVLAVLVFGTLLIALNVYQLYHLSANHMFQKFPDRLSKKPIAWIYSEQVGTGDPSLSKCLRSLCYILYCCRVHLAHNHHVFGSNPYPA